jgi:beta-glucosidase
VDAVEEWGVGMGKEFYDKGSNVLLGPGLCVARIPRNGRNFEYLSGEDPYLGSALVRPAVAGIQSQRVIANAKHFVLNSQESNRHGDSSDADERTRYEMYYPPFAGAIEAGVGSVMCSYNRVDGTYACENNVALGTDLKGRALGASATFDGFVMSVPPARAEPAISWPRAPGL